jgi:hypothetical protein
MGEAVKDNLIAAAVLYALAVGLGLLSIYADDSGVAIIGLMPAFMGALMLDQAFDMAEVGL